MVSIYFSTPLFTCGCSRINRLPMTELMMGIGFYLPRCTAAGRLGWLDAFERVLHWGSCFKLLNRSRLWQTVSEWVVSELVRASDWHARRGRTSVQRPFNSLRALAAVHQELLKMIRTVLCFLGLLVGGSQGMDAWLWEVWENRLALNQHCTEGVYLNEGDVRGVGRICCVLLCSLGTSLWRKHFFW